MPTPTTLPQNLILPSTPAGLARAAQLLKDGRLVILPTETVYGIAVNLLSPSARAAATAIKGTKQNWVLHVASPEDVLAWAPSLSPIGRRLITKALPGPIAFQIQLTESDAAAARARLGGGEVANEVLLPDPHQASSPSAKTQAPSPVYLTIRCPDFPQTQKILADAGVPIAIIGAGTPAQPGIFELADLPEGLLQSDAAGSGKTADEGGATASGGGAMVDGGERGASGGGVAAAVDGGPTRYRRSSTVVKIEGDHFSITRPGVIDERIIQKLADFNILFICSGNTCRSPMASAIATKMLADNLGIHPTELPLRHIVVQSAGVHASRGHRATREAVEAAKSLGADLASHISQPATQDLLRRADVIYTMTDAHRDEVAHLFPAAMRKTQRLDPQGDVSDPIGSNLSVYQEVAVHLSEVLKQRLSELRI